MIAKAAAAALAFIMLMFVVAFLVVISAITSHSQTPNPGLPPSYYNHGGTVTPDNVYRGALPQGGWDKGEAYANPCR